MNLNLHIDKVRKLISVSDINIGTAATPIEIIAQIQRLGYESQQHSSEQYIVVAFRDWSSAVAVAVRFLGGRLSSIVIGCLDMPKDENELQCALTLFAEAAKKLRPLSSIISYKVGQDFHDMNPYLTIKLK